MKFFGIGVIDLNSIMSKKDPFNLFNGRHPYEEQSIKAFQNFCKKNKILHYSAPKNDDFVLKAYAKARAGKYKYLIMQPL